MKERKTGMAAVILVLMLACIAIGYFLGRATVSPGVAAAVLTERAAPSQESALTAPAKEEKTEGEPGQREQTEWTPEAEPTEEDGPVCINTASPEELETLPGIGPKLAERIVAYREENGPFTTVEELCEVSGIGEKVLEKIGTRAVVGG